MHATDPLTEGREALERQEWSHAHELLRKADSADALEPDDLIGLAKTAWWTGNPGESIEMRERAYALWVERGQRSKAALAALTLRREYSSKLAHSIAMGWMNRAETLLRDEPESPAHGYLEIAHGEIAWDQHGDFDAALAHMDRAVEISQHFDDPDLQAWALMRRGMVLVAKGELEAGWALMEEVSARAVGGELGAYTTGAVFCNVIEMCRDLADLRRASEWAEAADRWCERQSITGFPGVCRVHRAEIMRLVGSWSEAEAEVRRACDELREFNPSAAAAAFHELGEVRLRVGDSQAARDAFAHARELGEDPQPGLALLHLLEGKVDAGAASIRRSLDDVVWDRFARSRLLPAQATIAYAAGDARTARIAADELAAIAEEIDTTAIRASAAYAAGIAALLESDVSGAIRSLRRSAQLWREVDAPYETATSSRALADAYLAEGDHEAARLELSSARTTFERLGAIPDSARCAERLERLSAAGAPAPRAVRTFMFTDIVGSTALVEAIGDEAWRDLKRWHDESLRKCFAEHGGEEIDHAGDGFFVAFPDAGAALECATGIQQRLTEHRKEHGFAPRVRIGLHATEAERTQDGYAGLGVNLAARIGALADGGRIVASLETVRDRGFSTSEPRSARLKGVAEPVEIVDVEWT